MDRLISIYALLFVRPWLVAGIIIASVGIALIVFAGGYYALAAYGQANLDDLRVPRSETGLAPADATQRPAPSAAEAAPAGTQIQTQRPAAVTTPAPATGGADGPADPDINRIILIPEPAQPQPGGEPGPAAADGDTEPEDGFYDEYGIPQDFSHYEAESGAEALTAPPITAFHPVIPDDLARPYGWMPRPTRIIIPAIDLDSRVVDLHIVRDGDERVWETADHAVGFHVGSATPGERGNTVMSGHVNSPFRGEGSIFRRLDEIAPLLRRGETVDVLLEAGETRYLYRVTDTTITLPEDVNVFRATSTPSLSLVTCAPATTYSHRFIVNATLIGTAPLGV